MGGITQITEINVQIYPDYDTYTNCVSDQLQCYAKVNKYCASLETNYLKGACRQLADDLLSTNMCFCDQVDDRFNNQWRCNVSSFDGSCLEICVCGLAVSVQEGQRQYSVVRQD